MKEFRHLGSTNQNQTYFRRQTDFPEFNFVDLQKRIGKMQEGDWKTFQVRSAILFCPFGSYMPPFSSFLFILLLKTAGVLGCKHYMRGCRLRANCCQKFFTCRLCHDEESDHKLDRYLITSFCLQDFTLCCRYATEEMQCMYCGGVV